MQRISDRQTLRTVRQALREAGKTVALVPTMGNLHDGHLELVKQARSRADFVITTIFVNPLQFGPGEDLDAYPRTLEADCEKLAAAACDAVFHPTMQEIYGDLPLAEQTVIHVPGVSENYCGKSRPGHFDGVATVVNKLFNLTLPEIAVFGLKDYQQFLVISKMVADTCMPVSLHGVEIVRESSGLAMSSRNGYLSPEQKSQAAVLYQTLKQTQQSLVAGERDLQQLTDQAMTSISAAGLTPDYFAICAADTLKPATANDRELVILTAAYVGKSRLIDNIRLHI